MKKWKIEFTKPAFEDIQQAVSYFNATPAPIGYRFLSDLENAVKALEINPFFQIRYKKIRCLRLRKFPYLIHYQVFSSKSIVRIKAVLHTSRNWESNP